jgi:hypothetical protein
MKIRAKRTQLSLKGWIRSVQIFNAISRGQALLLMNAQRKQRIPNLKLTIRPDPTVLRNFARQSISCIISLSYSRHRPIAPTVLIQSSDPTLSGSLEERLGKAGLGWVGGLQSRSFHPFRLNPAFYFFLQKPNMVPSDGILGTHYYNEPCIKTLRWTSRREEE